MRIAIIIGIVGLILLCWASTLNPYKDSSKMSDAMLDYPQGNTDSHLASEKYWAIRDAQLTQKYSLQDCGLTMIGVALALIVIIRLYSIRRLSDLLQISTPRKLWKTIALGVISAILTPLSYGASLILGAWRDEFPPWADSLMIPFMGIPLMFVIFILFVGLFSFLGHLNFKGGQTIGSSFRKANRPELKYFIIFGIPLFVASLFTLLSIISGDILFFIPGILWVIYFLFLFAGEQEVPAA